MDGFSDKLKTILSDPESLSTIMNLAKDFSASSPQSESVPVQGDGEDQVDSGDAAPVISSPSATELMRIPGMGEILRAIGTGSHERLCLLQAMRPFVKETKKPKLDKIIQAMKTLDLFTAAQKLL